MEQKKESQKIEGFQQRILESFGTIKELLMGRVNVHHSIGLFGLVERDGSHYGRPIKRVEGKMDSQTLLIHSYHHNFRYKCPYAEKCSNKRPNSATCLSPTHLNWVGCGKYRSFEEKAYR